MNSKEWFHFSFLCGEFKIPLKLLQINHKMCDFTLAKFDKNIYMFMYKFRSYTKGT